MTDDDALRAAISLAVLDAEEDQRRLLDSIVLVAKAIFDATASSIFLLDAATGELVFEAVAGEGESFLAGSRIPAGKGIAGWVLSACQPVLIDDLAADSRFASDVAQSTGYVPATLMATPVMCGEEAVGVLEVLDAAPSASSPLARLELLSLFGMQAAAALRIVQRSRAARSLLMTANGQVAELVTALRAATKLRDQLMGLDIPSR